MTFNHFILFTLALFCTALLKAQAPANDRCDGAYEIMIPDGGYGFGSFSSPKSRLQAATTQTGEYFSSSFINNGLNQKTLWYKFTTTVTRSVTIEVKQENTQINQSSAGLRIYKTTACVPDSAESSQEFAPIPNFGNTGNSCVPPGTYYIQLCAAADANDSVWISMRLLPSSPASYDERTTAYQFGIVNASRTTATSLGCYSKSSQQEICTSLGPDYPDYTQTVWLTFQTPNIADYLLIDGSAYQDIADAGYKVGFSLFKGDARNSTAVLIPVDTGLIFNRSAFFKVYECAGLQPRTVYSVQLFFHKDATSTLQIYMLGASGDSARSGNPRTLPAAYRHGTLSQQTKITEDFISCNARLDRNMCGTVTPGPSFITTLPANSYKSKDTFEYGFWITFRLPKKGVIQTSLWLTDTNNAQNLISATSIYRNKYYVLKIFKGDVYADCNLQSVSSNILMYDENSLCLDSGEYSLQILFSGRNTSATAIKNYLLYGKKFRLYLYYKQAVEQKVALHDAPFKAENLGDINTAPLKTAYSIKDYFGGLTDNRVIGGSPMKTNSCYREFYLSEKSQVRIVDSISYLSNFFYNTYLFKGRGSADASTLTLVPIQYGPNPFSQSNFSRIFESNNCAPLEAGWYTIISTTDITCENSLDTLQSQIKVSITPAPQPNYNKPYKAYMINGGNPVSFSPNSGTQQIPIHKNTFVLPLGCFGCESDPVSSMCMPASSSKSSLYYVIDIAEECQLFIRPDYYSSFLLYKLNVKTDSLQLTDASKIIRSCNNGNEFCRLQPGYYTLVVLDNPGCKTYNYFITLDKVMYSAYDHAYNSGDMGVIPASGNSVKSQVDVVSCTTGHGVTDPKSTGTYTTYPIPPNRLKQRNAFAEIDNNWFTFSLSGTGTVKVKVNVVAPASASYLPSFTVYRTNARGYLTLQQLRDQGQLDSSIAMGLTRIGENSPNLREMNFSQSSCDTLRYFIIADRANIEYNYYIQAEVQYTGQSNTRQGDYCSNANAFSAVNPGTVSSTVAVNCHTIGESFGEDGSNMDCLFDQPGYKSSWFKFTLNRIQKTDLSFSLENQTNASSQQIRYRILYGSCDAMTPGPCVETALSTFRLDCMLPGDYYIQVITPATATGNIKVNVNVANSPFPLCKATSPLQPLAKFIFMKERCNTDTFSFKNLSSAGAQITYFWNFGNGITSTEKAPMVHFANNNRIDTYYVKLRVHNTFYNLYDSLTLPLYASKDTTSLDAGSNVYARVNTGVQLNATSNITGGVFKWTPATGLNDPNKQNPVSTAGQHRVYEVTMTANQCTYKDSVIIYRYDDVGPLISSNNTLCKGNKDTIRLEGKTISGKYKWSTGDTTTYIRVSEPAVYYLEIVSANVTYLDTINLREREPLAPLLGNDTTVCRYAVLPIKVNGIYSTYKWSTGNTGNSISTDSAGIYTVTVNDGQCKFSDTIVVSHTRLTISPISDTVICSGNKTLQLSAFNGFDQYLWSTGDASQKTTIRSHGTYIVKLSKNDCFEFDTIEVKEKQVSYNPIADTVICPHDSLLLHTDNHSSYLWSNGDTNRFTTIYNPGSYFLRVENSGCLIQDTFDIALHPIKLLLPADTFYCRYNSVILDAGPGYDTYIWSTGETQRSININTEGEYSVKVKQGLCYAYDTSSVKLIRSNPVLNDTIICPDTEIELNTGAKADSYLWSTGETTETIRVSNASVYSVIVFSKGCSDSASATVSMFKTARNFLRADTSICKPFGVILDAGYGHDILWLPSGEMHNPITAIEYGEYIALKKDDNGCLVSDTLYIHKDCGPSKLFVPNVFTINNDGINDVFKAVGFEITDFSIHIYNRWGQEVFETDDVNKGWDGNHNARPAPADVYVWTINYRDNKGLNRAAFGNLTLLR